MPSILIIEDDHDVRVTLRSILEDEGYVVHTAANGRDALAALKEMSAPPGLVLVDLMMPIMDGWEFVAILKTRTSLAGIPFAIQSAYVDRAPIPEGAVAVMKKPTDVIALLALVERHCR